MGLGIDISKTNRFEKFIDNEKFYKRIFTNNEKDIINKNSYKRKLELIAGKFSAKEAVSKALGTGIGKISFKDIEILNDNNGKPIVVLHNEALNFWINNFKGSINISISHDGGFVISVAITEELNKIKYDVKIKNLLKDRKSDSHKGDYGKVALIGGSKGMCGSIYLSSMAALRTGSGLVYTIVPEEISTIMEIKSLENIIIPIKNNELNNHFDLFNNLDAFGIGPGMGECYNLDYIKYFSDHFNKPLLVDADGLNYISKNINYLNEINNVILTPHEMEMSRLTGHSVDFIHNNRERIALDFANKYNLILVLKGYNTIVTNGNDIYINKTGNPGMATAGSGDVLTGIITSLLGQEYDSFNAAKLGVYIHGISGDLAKEQYGEDGLMARDIIDNISKAIKLIRECN